MGGHDYRARRIGATDEATMRDRGARQLCFRLILWALATVISAATAPPFAHAGSRGADPTTVSLRLRNVPAKEAYAELARRAKVDIRYESKEPKADARVTVNLVHEPLWTALAQINERAGMQVSGVRREEQPQIILQPQMPNVPTHPIASSVNGMFFGTVYQMTIDKETGPRDHAKPYPASIAVTLRLEPKVRALLWHSIVIDEVFDESGRALEGRIGTKVSPFNNGTASTVYNLAPRVWPRKIGRLRVRGKVFVSAESETARVTELMQSRATTVNAAGFRIETTGVKTDDGRRYVLNMTRLGAAGPDWLRLAGRVGLLEPVILDENGRRVSSIRTDIDPFGKSCRVFVRTFNPSPKDPRPVGDPHTLLLEIPTEVEEYDVELQFGDMTLR